jgi:hypothetical protein
MSSRTRNLYITIVVSLILITAGIALLIILLSKNTTNKVITPESYTLNNVTTLTNVTPESYSSLVLSNEAGDLSSTDVQFPRGIIALWSGEVANIPLGWGLCNGSNGTPDLTNRFIMGANPSKAEGGDDTKTFRPINSTGGSSTVTLTLENIPPHTHRYTKSRSQGTKAIPYASNSSYPIDDSVKYTGYTGGGLNGLPAPYEILPPYYSLAYIMRL